MSKQPRDDIFPEDQEDMDSEGETMLDADEVAEELTNHGDAVDDDDDMDEEMGEDQVMEEIALQNDSSAHFDAFNDSIFCIASHPRFPQLVALGGSEGEELGGVGFLFDSTPEDGPVLPASYQADPNQPRERATLGPLSKLEGHTDSINALAFTLPSGDALLSGGLDGQLKAWVPAKKSRPLGPWKQLASVREVEEINWILPCPSAEYANTIALGASDGSVWVYTVDPSSTDSDDVLQIVQSYFIHTSSCTAGSWSADGKLLATVSDEGSLYVWDVFGAAAAAGVTASSSGSQAIVGLTAADQRFAVEGGLYSVAIAPSGSFLVVGGAGGAMKVVGLPSLGETAKGGAKGKGGKAKASSGQAGVILADLNSQSSSVESLAFAPPPSTLFAAGSVDGSIALFDSAYRFATRRHIKEAHEEFAVVQIKFSEKDPRILISAGMDGVVRLWNTQGGTAVANHGFAGEFRGHRGEGEGGGVLGFVEKNGRVVTAGDDGVSLVFDVLP